ncbi:serine aminopeptidase domain-containing protein [Brevifollis gellanilyticus]|uniref:Serine aminopeptidase S33 domain-containing protein n=1 Tax=Brevifollis gellanilyticus TaxID=748831 RepID=A0A512MDW3_9BACT|nr:alpha/beta hydrolase [Brevifollis gellanilyticus]GEP44935.1 hypothetical protein BGE01nite_42260 [Brevifollis gellanilyticus]
MSRNSPSSLGDTACQRVASMEGGFVPGKAFFLALLGCALGFGGWIYEFAPRASEAAGTQAAPLQLELSTGPFEARCYDCQGTPRGIVVLASGEGGWSCWEERTAHHLMEAGYIVGAWDCRKFADSRRYDQAALAEGWQALSQALIQRCHADATMPLWYGGWSAGAQQAVAAAAAHASPLPLTGLLLAAPGARGRYGITDSDLLGRQPSGGGTFALVDLAPDLVDVPVAQFMAEQDPQDDVAWLEKLGTSPYQLYPLPGMSHDMERAGSHFQAALDAAMTWTRSAAPPRKTLMLPRGHTARPASTGKRPGPGT